MDDLTHTFEEVRLVYRNKIKANNRPKITDPKAAFNVLNKIWDKDQIDLVEECKLLLMDRQLRLMSIANLSFGGMTQAVVDPRMIFTIALKRRADRFIIAHNHPSGTLSPSKHDIRITDKLRMLGEAMNLQMEDHIIMTSQGYFSMTQDCAGSFG